MGFMSGVLQGEQAAQRQASVDAEISQKRQQMEIQKAEFEEWKATQKPRIQKAFTAAEMAEETLGEKQLQNELSASTLQDKIRIKEEDRKQEEIQTASDRFDQSVQAADEKRKQEAHEKEMKNIDSQIADRGKDDDDELDITDWVNLDEMSINDMYHRWQKMRPQATDKILAASAQVNKAQEKDVRGIERKIQKIDMAQQLLADGAKTGKLQPFFDSMSGYADALGFRPQWLKDKKLPEQQELATFMNAVHVEDILTAPKLSDTDVTEIKTANANMKNTEEANELLLKYQEADLEMQLVKLDLQTQATASGVSHWFGVKQFEVTYGKNFRVAGKKADGTFIMYTTHRDNYRKAYGADVGEKEIADAWRRLYHAK